MFVVGGIYRYSYLWQREHLRGEEAGRKVRPTALLLRSAQYPDLLFLFAISSRPPEPGQIARKLPALECRRAGLREPCWIVLDEFNISLATSPYDFASLEPLGTLSPAYLAKLSAEVRRLVRSGMTSPIKRLT